MKIQYYIFSVIAMILFSCSTTKLPSVTSFKEINYGKQVQYIQLDDIQLAYTEEGSEHQQTILFIHGLGSYLPAWKKNTEVLSKRYRCIAIDLPGYGHSSKGNYDYSMTFFANVISEFAQKKGLQKIHLAGHSMGGQIALTLALTQPELVDRLILVAPAGFETFNKGQRQWFRDVMTVDGVRLTTVEQIRLNLAYNFYDLNEDAQFMIDDRIAMRSAVDFVPYCYAIAESVSGMVDQPVYDFLPQIQHKTLCVFGANDNLIPNRFLNAGRTEDVAKKGAERLPNCKLEVLPKAGHFVMFEKYEAFNKLVEQFLN